MAGKKGKVGRPSFRDARSGTALQSSGTGAKMNCSQIPKKSRHFGAERMPKITTPLPFTPANLWEWCLNKYSKSSEYRVLRGGSFLNSPNFAACATRVSPEPFVDVNSFAFRVGVVSSPIAPFDL